MPSSLVSNLKSDYMGASGDMLSKRDPKPILVYVESYEDVAFWYSILSKHNSSRYRFDVVPASKTSLTKGKNEALKRSEDLLNMSLGDFLIICVDSDYDYLFQNDTSQSTKINKSDYIFQTYSYATENLRCYAACLDELCVKSSNRVNDKLDFQELLKNYSEIIYDAFVWSVCLSTNVSDNSFNIKHFNQAISICKEGTIRIDLANKDKLLLTIKKQVDDLVSAWQSQYHSLENKIPDWKERLTQLGVKPSETYLFVRGHTLQEDFLIHFLKHICNTLHKEEINRIKNISGNNVNDSIKQYTNSTTNIETILKVNTTFETCFLYRKIQHDIEQFMTKLNR